VTLPPIDSLEGLSLAELRGLVAALIGEVRSLQGRVASLEIENQALRAENEVLRAENPALRVENQALKDEIARLKNLPPRPPVKPAKPSGMEKATQPSSSKGKGKRRRRGAKRDGAQVNREVTVAVSAPVGSRFKGYETILVRDLVLSAEVVRYRRECWLTPGGERLVAPLPAGIVGGWVRETWPDRPDFVAIDGKTSRRSHDRGAGKAALHMVSAFATTSRLVLGQEAVAAKSNETTAIPVLIERLAADGGLKGATVSIDAIACNGTIATAVTEAGADYLLAVKANQPTLRAEIEACFATAPAEALDTATDLDKGHGRIEERTVTVSRETDWLDGQRRFPGELRLPGAAAIVRVRSRTELKDRCRTDTRYYITSAALDAATAAHAVRGHWGIENRLHWVLDVVFGDDQSRLRKGHGARNMAVVRHFAINLVRAASDKKSIKLRRKLAGWDTRYLASILGASLR
jgi:predicted transposase YbfD/YdcC/regulator of replication initiation timing